MEIKLSIDEINDILKMSKQFIDKKNVCPAFTQITLRLKNDTLSAIALDGYSMSVMQFPYKEENAQEGSMMIPLLPLFGKNDVYCHIIQDDKEVTFKTASGSQSYRRVDGEPFTDYERFLPKDEKKADTFYFDPKRLAAALTAFSGSEAVKIDYYGRTSGVVITNGNRMALVLPVNP